MYRNCLEGEERKPLWSLNSVTLQSKQSQDSLQVTAIQFALCPSWSTVGLVKDSVRARLPTYAWHKAEVKSLGEENSG